MATVAVGHWLPDVKCKKGRRGEWISASRRVASMRQRKTCG
jgi:hypothetical protein